MSAGGRGVLAVFKYLDHVTHAIERIRERSDCAGYEVFSPTSYHDIEHASNFSPSPVRYYTLIGGLTGCFTGLALCLGIDWDWPLVVGGKTPGIYSFPAFVVIMFELTILLGALSTIAGMLIHCRIPNPKAKVIDTRTTDDRFAIFVPGATVDGQQARMLKELGAQEIRAV